MPLTKPSFAITRREVFKNVIYKIILLSCYKCLVWNLKAKKAECGIEASEFWKWKNKRLTRRFVPTYMCNNCTMCMYSIITWRNTAMYNTVLHRRSRAMKTTSMVEQFRFEQHCESGTTLSYESTSLTSGIRVRTSPSLIGVKFHDCCCNPLCHLYVRIWRQFCRPSTFKARLLFPCLWSRGCAR